MTPEQQRIEKLEQQLQHLQSALYAQTAETQSLLALLRPKDSAQAEDYNQRFLDGRNERLRTLLLLLEHTDPALAAKLSDLLSSPGLSFPVKWD